MEGKKLVELKDHESIIAHIDMMQGIINRLADNSAKCKDWCFAFVGALIIFLVSGDNLAGRWMFGIGYVIVLMFYLLDCYYLGLERKIRDNYEAFVKSLNDSGSVDNSQDDDSVDTGTVHPTPVLNKLSKNIFLPNLEFSKPKKSVFNGKELEGIAYGMCSLSTFIPYFCLVALLIILTIFYQPSLTDCQCCCC